MRTSFVILLALGSTANANPKLGTRDIGSDTATIHLPASALSVTRVSRDVPKSDGVHPVDPVPPQTEIRLTAAVLPQGLKLHHGEVFLATRPIDFKLPPALAHAKTIDVDLEWKLKETYYNDMVGANPICVPRLEEWLVVTIHGTDLKFDDTQEVPLSGMSGRCG